MKPLACGRPERRRTVVLVLGAVEVIAVMFGVLVLFLRILNV